MNPISTNIGGNYLLKFHHWKTNVVVITFSIVSVDHLLVCASTVKTYGYPMYQFLCSLENDISDI